jgi:ribose/xylose/arabinose/galactoside ABC-type transport system permease subunit
MTTATARGDTPPRPRFDFGAFLQRYGTICIFLVLFIAASIASEPFHSYLNIMKVLRQVAADTGIMAVGMLFVILTRGIDLSVGSIAAVGSVLMGVLIARQGYSLPVAIVLVLLAGAGLGLITGVMVAYLRLPSFVMSLAMMAIGRGLALNLSSGQPIPLGDAGETIGNFGLGFALGLPQPVILMFAVFVFAGFVLNFTRFGRIVKAIGSNEEAVRLSGIAVPRYVVAVYVISGSLAALAGVIYVSRTVSGSATVGVGAELNVIAAVVIGGASLMGGRGGVFNTLLGALVMGMINNIMNLTGVPGYNQQIYMGVIIVFAMLLQYGASWRR